jgi:hypothetical protein
MVGQNIFWYIVYGDVQHLCIDKIDRE